VSLNLADSGLYTLYDQILRRAKMTASARVQGVSDVFTEDSADIGGERNADVAKTVTARICGSI